MIYLLFEKQAGATGGNFPFSFSLPDYAGEGEIYVQSLQLGTEPRENRISFTENRNVLLADRLLLVGQTIRAWEYSNPSVILTAQELVEDRLKAKEGIKIQAKPKTRIKGVLNMPNVANTEDIIQILLKTP